MDSGLSCKPWKTTLASASRRPMPMAWPMPWEEPVTRAARPSSENAFVMELQEGACVCVRDAIHHGGRTGLECSDFLLIGADEPYHFAVDGGGVAVEG